MTSAAPRALLLAALVTLTTGCGHGCGGNHGGGAHSASSHSGSSHSSSHSGSSHSGSSHSGSSSSHTASNGRSGSSGSGSHGSHRGSHSGGSGAAGEYVGWDGSSDPADYGYSVPPAPGGYGPDDVGPPPARAETPCQRAQREWLAQYPGLPRPYALRCGPNGEWGAGSPNARPDPGDAPLEGASG